MTRQYTTDECLQEYYVSLEKQLKEKDAMIDWLAGELFARDRNYTAEYPSYWIRKAQEAVKKNV